MLNGLLELDTHVVIWITSHRIASLNTPLWLISVICRGGTLWLAIGAALTLGRRMSVRSFLQFVLAILTASLLANQIIKPLVGRQRPFEHVERLEVIGGRPDDSSFPSGHSATAFAGALVLTRLVPGAQAVWWTLAAIVAFSRVYLGVHYPLDVLAGAIVGVACGIGALKVRWRTSLPST
jgi:undecaprenyl-diphosphatase